MGAPSASGQQPPLPVYRPNLENGWRARRQNGPLGGYGRVPRSTGIGRQDQPWLGTSRREGRPAPHAEIGLGTADGSVLAFWPVPPCTQTPLDAAPSADGRHPRTRERAPSHSWWCRWHPAAVLQRGTRSPGKSGPPGRRTLPAGPDPWVWAAAFVQRQQKAPEARTCACARARVQDNLGQCSHATGLGTVSCPRRAGSELGLTEPTLPLALPRSASYREATRVAPFLPCSVSSAWRYGVRREHPVASRTCADGPAIGHRQLGWWQQDGTAIASSARQSMPAGEGAEGSGVGCRQSGCSNCITTLPCPTAHLGHGEAAVGDSDGAAGVSTDPPNKKRASGCSALLTRRHLQWEAHQPRQQGRQQGIACFSGRGVAVAPGCDFGRHPPPAGGAGRERGWQCGAGATACRGLP